MQYTHALCQLGRFRNPVFPADFRSYVIFPPLRVSFCVPGHSGRRQGELRPAQGVVPPRTAAVIRTPREADTSARGQGACPGARRPLDLLVTDSSAISQTQLSHRRDFRHP